MKAFHSKLPVKEEIVGQQVNPFEQLKSFTRFRADLLKTPDVLSFILMEYMRVGVLDKTNVWYYRGLVSKNNKQIIEIVESVFVSSGSPLRTKISSKSERATSIFTS